MIGKTAQRLENFIARDEKPSWWYLVGMGLSTLLAVGCWMQTGLYVSSLDSPSYESLRDHMAKSRALQDALATKSGKNKSAEKITYLQFEKSEEAKLEAARKFILSDDELNEKLNNQFGTSLRDVKAVIAPIWETDDPGYCEVIGITREGGRSDFRQSSKSCSIGATTIRDRPGLSQRTLDGTPRILLNPNALADTTWTRRVVFHEMMHAMNLPAYSPPLAWAQTDLTYLPEYCWFIAKAGLGGGDEKMYRTFVGFFVLTCFVSLFLFVRYHRRQARGGVLTRP